MVFKIRNASWTRWKHKPPESNMRDEHCDRAVPGRHGIALHVHALGTRRCRARVTPEDGIYTEYV
jgi:hypothetical protein